MCTDRTGETLKLEAISFTYYVMKLGQSRMRCDKLEDTCDSESFHHGTSKSLLARCWGQPFPFRCACGSGDYVQSLSYKTMRTLTPGLTATRFTQQIHPY